MLKTDFERIVREHQSMVYSIAYNFFRNSALAEEVAQDVFLQLFESLDAVASETHLVAWLRLIATHRCIDVSRQASTRYEVQVDRMPEIPANGSDPDPLLGDRVRRLVASLPEKPRAVVILRYGEDMDPEEISRTLQMPVSTVWSHLQRATALLREKANRYLKVKDDERIGRV